jgi:hypothetical protein
MACMECVHVCPVEKTLELKLQWSNLKLSVYALAAVVLIIYYSFIGFAQVTGNWQNDIPVHEYVERIQDIDNPIYTHNRGNVVTDDTQY